MRIAGISALVLIALALAVWITGVRVVVVQPIGAIPDGVTAIVSGVPGLRLIDSPDAFCYRRQGGVSLLCRGATAAAIARDGNIHLRLPYSSVLFSLTGGPYRND